MGKKPRFKREQDELERLQAEVRTLKSTNRSLLKRLKKVSKGYNKYLTEETEEDKQEAMEEVVKEVNKICFVCGGNYLKIELLGRYFRQCDRCGKRGRAKKI